MITYDRDTELLSKRIWKTITSAELQDIAKFEAAQPANCPKCHARVHSSLLPEQIVHDIANCPGKPAANP